MNGLGSPLTLFYIFVGFRVRFFFGQTTFCSDNRLRITLSLTPIECVRPHRPFLDGSNRAKYHFLEIICHRHHDWLRRMIEKIIAAWIELFAILIGQEILVQNFSLSCKHENNGFSLLNTNRKITFVLLCVSIADKFAWQQHIYIWFTSKLHAWKATLDSSGALKWPTSQSLHGNWCEATSRGRRICDERTHMSQLQQDSVTHTVTHTCVRK